MLLLTEVGIEYHFPVDDPSICDPILPSEGIVSDHSVKSLCALSEEALC